MEFFIWLFLGNSFVVVLVRMGLLIPFFFFFFPGVNCENNFDDCASNPCIHGDCIDGINRYNCACKPGFTGKVSDPIALSHFEDSYPGS